MLRTTSSDGVVQLQHPIPDLQSLQGAYVQNVERLEETAERMSSASSDIGEEIRKLQLEQRLSISRQSSLRSNPVQEEDNATRTRSRNVSTGSFTNSIVEVNSAARWGGYSPVGYLGSPRGSLRSGSWSQVSATPSVARRRSTSKGSRLGQVSKVDDDANLVQVPPKDSTSRDTTPRLDGLHITNDDAFSDVSGRNSPQETAPDAKPAARLPSDGSFTKLYNEMAESNGSASHMSAPRIPSDTSFTDVYDQIATEIREQLDDAGNEVKRPAMNNSTQPTPVEEQKQRRSRLILEQIDDRHLQFGTSGPQEESDEDDPEAQRPILRIHRAESLDQRSTQHLDEATDRPMTAASTDTYQQAQMLFEDFDGAHYAPNIRDTLRDPSDGSANRPPSMMMAPPNVDSRIPPPASGMVFYPAPVPRTLNLPQRLSQLPSPAVLAKRRTQMLGALPAEVRKSAPWLAQEQERRSAMLDGRRSMNLDSVPPQLRASMFFETPGSSQEVEMIDDSAMATLEDMLDASAVAPVNAFTDHPIVGHIGAEVYRREAPAKGTASSSLPKPDNADKKKRRSSMLGLRRHSISSTDRLREQNNKTPSKLQKRYSRSNSLAGALDDSALARGPAGDLRGSTRSAESTPERRREFDDEDERSEAEEEEEEEEETPYAGPPTTLLAELQQRKAQQKQRNRTAATAFPNGMHATLLEMDAVLQIQKQKRKKARVTLAWEDPDAVAAVGAADQNDEDIPLGMLFPSKKKRDPADWNRPLGLLEKRELEENEPLSRRRNRLLGIDFTKRTPSPGKTVPGVQITNEEDDDESEHEGETLGQRLRRLKNEKELDAALGEVKTRPISQAFSIEMLTELGVPQEKPEDKRQSTGSQAAKSVSSKDNQTPDRSDSNTPCEEEETLGQRRARLQREALAQNRRASRMSLGPEARLGDGLADAANQASTMLATPATTAPLRSSRSMAELLQQFPTGKHEARKVSNEALTSALPPGSLLAQNEEKQAAQKARMQGSTKRVTSYGFDAPLIDTTGMQGPTIEGRKSRGFMGGIYNNANGGLLNAAERGLLMGAAEQQQMQQLQQQQQAALLYAYQNPFGYPSALNPTATPYAYAYPNPAFPTAFQNPYGYAANMMYGPPVPQQQPASASMTNPNLLLHNMGGSLNRQSRANLADGMYQPHQRLSTMPNLQLQHQQTQEGGFMDQKGRDRIDAWRFGVMP